MATLHGTFVTQHQSDTLMKKEFWRKAPQCAKCQFHCPEGTRPDSIDPTTLWKEACRCSGYSFWPELEEAAICFDFKTEGRNSSSKDIAEKEQWARRHLCINCAFYETNGLSAYVPLDGKSEESKLLEWMQERRCRGYVHVKEKDLNCFCSSFLSLNQWAEVQACPPCSEEKGKKWREFIALNTAGIPAK